MPAFNPNIEERFWSKVNVTEGCWLWLAQINNKGYGCFRLSRPRRMEFVHRFSWQLLRGPIPDGLNVLHKCDNPPCCNPDHLFLGTKIDNARDMAAKLRGNTQKLTPEQIEIIRKTVWGHQSYGRTEQLAKEFGVHRSTIRRTAQLISFKLR